MNELTWALLIGAAMGIVWNIYLYIFDAIREKYGNDKEQGDE